MSLIAHGHIELNQLLDKIKVSNHGLVVKDNTSTWEVVVPDGQGTGFNEQTWGELTRKLYLRPITDLSQENFAKIVEETVCYVKSSTKEKSTVVSTSDDDEATDFFNFR